MDDNNISWCVYKHENLKNGKVYIGKTCKKPEYRWNDGKGYKSQKYFWNSILNKFTLLKNINDNHRPIIQVQSVRNFIFKFKE